MAIVKRFRGVFYNPERIEDLSLVTAPPYDIIDENEQEELYHRHPQNVIRLILGRQYPDDTRTSNRYTRASDALEQWLTTGVLKAEDEPTIYTCNQTFRAGNDIRTRRGLIACVKLEDFKTGVIRPHEYTLPGPKEDRMQLMQACKGNLSPVFGLFPDKDLSIYALLSAASQLEPDMTVTDKDSVVHRVWRISDRKLGDAILGALKDKPILIADGHHRYETALAYRNAMRRKHGENPNAPYEYVYMVLVSMSDPGLFILPTHRSLRLPQMPPAETIIAKLRERFHVEPIGPAKNAAQWSQLEARMNAIRQTGKHAFGLALQNCPDLLVATLDESKGPLPVIENHSPQWSSLDVTLLHYLILDKVFGLPFDAERPNPKLRFSHDLSDVRERFLQGTDNCVFLLNAISPQEMNAVVETGERMPPKSTYFYPKQISGLLFYLHQFGVEQDQGGEQ